MSLLLRLNCFALVIPLRKRRAEEEDGERVREKERVGLSSVFFFRGRDEQEFPPPSLCFRTWLFSPIMINDPK